MRLSVDILDDEMTDGSYCKLLMNLHVSYAMKSVSFNMHWVIWLLPFLEGNLHYYFLITIFLRKEKPCFFVKDYLDSAHQGCYKSGK